MVFHEKYGWIHDPGFMDSLAKMRADAERYSEHIKQNIEADKSHHQAFVQQSQDTIQTLLKNEQAFLAEGEQIQQAKLREKQEVDDLNAQLAELKVKEDSLPEVLESFQQQYQTSKTELDARKKVYSEKDKKIKANAQRAKLGVEFYRSRFGLQFEKLSDDGLRVTFTNVDPNNHDRKFNFAILIDDTDKYVLTECTPRVDGAHTLVDELNKSNNIIRFVVQMRKKFQEKCVQ